MARIKLTHVNSFSDRYGKVRHYFRKRGCKDVTRTRANLPMTRRFLHSSSWSFLDDAWSLLCARLRCFDTINLRDDSLSAD
jgi:hypothetical protein